MSEINIERLTKASQQDYKDIARLLPQLSQKAHLSKDELDRAVDDDNIHFFIARAEGEIVGVGLLVILHILTERRGRIEDVVVDESCRSKGVGKKLMEFLLIAARGKGLDAIELSSAEHRKAANSLYKKLGFQKRETNVYRLEL